MAIPKNSRQMPHKRDIITAKDYCDLIYAWIQCNSEREGLDPAKRYIEKSKVNFSKIEKDFTNELGEKIMSRKTIGKYFKWLVDQGLIEEDGKVYRVRVLESDAADLIECKTLATLMNVFKRNSLNIYVYLHHRYHANKREGYIVTIKQIKEGVGIAASTTSNNAIVSDTLEILQRLELLSYEIRWEEEKSLLYINWVRSALPDI